MQSALLVEDDEAIRASLKSMLLEQLPDLRIHEAENGNQAIERYSDNRPDVIVMDIDLPGKNGLEAAREIRNMSIEAAIIFLTNYNDPEYLDVADALGCEHFLIKSDTSPNQLVCCVATALARDCSTLAWGRARSRTY